MVCTDAPAKILQVSRDATAKQVETNLLQTLMELKFNKGGEKKRRCSRKMEANERYAHECINTHKHTLKHQRKCQQVIA